MWSLPLTERALGRGYHLSWVFRRCHIEEACWTTHFTPFPVTIPAPLTLVTIYVISTITVVIPLSNDPHNICSVTQRSDTDTAMTLGFLVNPPGAILWWNIAQRLPTHRGVKIWLRRVVSPWAGYYYVFPRQTRLVWARDVRLLQGVKLAGYFPAFRRVIATGHCDTEWAGYNMVTEGATLAGGWGGTWRGCGACLSLNSTQTDNCFHAITMKLLSRENLLMLYLATH